MTPGTILYLTVRVLSPRLPADSEPWASKGHLWVTACDPRGNALQDEKGQTLEVQVTGSWLRTAADMRAAIMARGGRS